MAAERRATRPGEHDPPIPCPRCDSTNTKFCYYNNYNFSQPRHFCKSCRRYWTHGGTLRNIPVGGGSRKTAKRPRKNLSESIPPAPVFVSLPSAGSTGPGSTSGGGGGSGFPSLLSGVGPGIGNEVLTLGGLGLGLEDAGFGLGRGIWAFSEVGHLSGSVAGVGGASGGYGGGGRGSVSGEDAWQVRVGGESGFGVSADCLASLPELAVSTQANGLE